jgi:hypothetical protein
MLLRGGLQSGTYPLDHILKMTEVVLWLTLNQIVSDYAADQSLYTVEAKSYDPNGYNL